jgi:hypothetical protein
MISFKLSYLVKANLREQINKEIIVNPEFISLILGLTRISIKLSPIE